jgi:hypothetical protein
MILKFESKCFCVLSEYEKSLYYYTKCGDLMVLGVAIINNSSQRQTLDVDLVKRGLKFMKKRHPLLRAHLEHEPSNEDVYLIINKLDESAECELEWKTIESRDELNQELETFNCKMFHYEKKCLLWRCKVVEFKENDALKYAICLQIPLFITDGINITALLVELVNIINAILVDKVCDEMKTELELVDNLNIMTEKSKLFTEKQRKGVELKRNEQNNDFVLDKKFKSNAEKGLKINMMKFDRDVTNKLMKMCKEKNTKLTGLMNAAVLYALNDLYLENGLKFPQNISCGIPVNLRIRYQPNLEFSQVRFQVCLSSINLDSSDFGRFKNIWTDSDYVNKQIEKSACMDDGSLFLTTHDFESIKEFNSAIRAFLTSDARSSGVQTALAHGNTTDLIFSNTGKWVCDRMKQFVGPWQIAEIYYGDALSSTPCLLSALIFHLAFWNGELQLLLSSSKSSIAPQFTDRLLFLFERFIINCVSNFDDADK